jgi:hypothetical protein
VGFDGLAGNTAEAGGKADRAALEMVGPGSGAPKGGELGSGERIGAVVWGRETTEGEPLTGRTFSTVAEAWSKAGGMRFVKPEVLGAAACELLIGTELFTGFVFDRLRGT